MFSEIQSHEEKWFFVVVPLNLLCLPIMLCKYCKVFKMVFGKQNDESYNIYILAYIVYSFSFSWDWLYPCDMYGCDKLVSSTLRITCTMPTKRIDVRCPRLWQHFTHLGLCAAYSKLAPDIPNQATVSSSWDPKTTKKPHPGDNK